MKKLIWLLIFVSVTSAGTVHADSIRRESILSERRKRNYYLYVPEGIDKSKPAPLIVALHGSGDSGLMPVRRWRELAKRQGILIAGPNASDKEVWRIPEDGPEFIYEMVESLKKSHSIDPQRVYLFGHSGGATVALYLALLQSEYFAAAAIHAGAIRPEDGPLIDRTRRKIPLSLFVGTKDWLFPVAEQRGIHRMFTTRGFDAELTEIKGHTHDYASRSSEINAMIWNFFSKHRLNDAPKYQLYNWENVKPLVTEVREPASSN